MEKSILNVPLRKVHATEIVKGEKVREFRAFSDFWATRICEFDDPKDKYLATGIKWFDVVHFYPYNNKWHVDCECTGIEWCTVDEEFIEKYGKEVEVNIDDKVFVIHLGKVLDTNLA